MFRFNIQWLKSKHRLSLIAVFIILVTASANLVSQDNINTEMKAIHDAMKFLYPLATEKRKLNAMEAQQVTENLKALQAHIKQINPDLHGKSDTFNISYQALLGQLEQTQQALDRKEYTYALSLVSEIPQQCAFCHTQDEQLRNFDSSEIKKKLNTDFLRGEYNFMIRDYHQALLDYHDHLVKQRRIRHGKGNSEALEKILLIYVQVFQDIGNAEMYFNRLLDSGKLSPEVAIDVNLWLTDLGHIRYRYIRHAEMDLDTLESFVNAVLQISEAEAAPTYINEEDKVSALWLRSMLYDFMNQNPQHPDTAKILYWLASIESALDYGINYQLPEIYLKHCVMKYNKHPYAKKCFAQYELLVNFQFTGSGGTLLPIYKRNELEGLKNQLNR